MIIKFLIRWKAYNILTSWTSPYQEEHGIADLFSSCRLKFKTNNGASWWRSAAELFGFSFAHWTWFRLPVCDSISLINLLSVLERFKENHPDICTDSQNNNLQWHKFHLILLSRSVWHIQQSQSLINMPVWKLELMSFRVTGFFISKIL